MIDWRQMQTQAFGLLGILPEQFGRMTIAELVICQEGNKLRRKDREARDAWMMANMIQPHVKDRLRLLDFMPETREERLEELRKLQDAGIISPEEAVL